jgi:hypothetical protein
VRRFRSRYHVLPLGLFAGFEWLAGRLPPGLRTLLARLFLPRHLCMWAVK